MVVAALVASTLAAVGAAVGGCSASKIDAPKKRPPPLVQVGSPEVRDVDLALSYTVDVRPIEQADLQSKVAGYVEKIYVDRGDQVKKGQLLAEIRPSDLPQQVQQAREQVGQTEASYRLASETARRARELYKREMISRAELDQAEAQLSVAQSARGGAESGLGVVRTRLAETHIVAPFAGWVTSRNLDPGALVQPGPQNASLLTLMRIDQVRLFVRAPEIDAPLVHRGQAATLAVDALPGKTFQGTVTRVPPALDQATRSLEAEIVIPNADETLKPGMYGRATITVGRHPRAVVLPADAVIAEEKQHTVYVVEGEHQEPGAKLPTATARQVAVTIGFDGGNWLEISAGLTGQESVILAGIDLVSDGAPVLVARKKVAAPADSPRAERKVPPEAPRAERKVPPKATD